MLENPEGTNAMGDFVDMPKDDRWIQLYSGAPYWPLYPERCTISIEDIAHSLANNNRFNGHTIEPYSVAQHSVLVSDLLDIWGLSHTNVPLQGLLHDASEAVLHDIVRPIKQDFMICMEPYTVVESRITEAIFAQFGLNTSIHQDVWRADNVLLVTEQRDLMAKSRRQWHKINADPLPTPIIPWPWREARTRFLDRFHELTDKKGV